MRLPYLDIQHEDEVCKDEDLQRLNLHISGLRRIFVEPYYWTYKNDKEVKKKWSIGRRAKALDAIKKGIKIIETNK